VGELLEIFKPDRLSIGAEADPQTAGFQRMSSQAWGRPEAALPFSHRLRGDAQLRQRLCIGMDEHRGGVLQEGDSGKRLRRQAWWTQFA
jgi:hypothetical protein